MNNTQFSLILLFCLIGFTVAQPLNQLKLDIANLDTDHIDCDMKLDIIDECGLQQGSSYRFTDFSYPTNSSSLASTCKRSADALKCLRAYSKCLPSLSKQVLNAMVGSRQRYNKKICPADKSTIPDAGLKFIELSKCMVDSKAASEKGLQAEINSVTIPEAIVRSKTDTNRLKLSCCSVARVRNEFMEATKPHCQKHATTASELIDSYLADTVGLVCPNFQHMSSECDKLPKLVPSKTPQHRYFIRPILDVIQTLA